MFLLQTWSTWIEGWDITRKTDHRCLVGIRSKMNLPSRIARLLDTIEHYSPTIIYQKGNLYSLPDWLSGFRSPKPSLSAPDDIAILAITNKLRDVDWHDVERMKEAMIQHNVEAPTMKEMILAENQFCGISK